MRHSIMWSGLLLLAVQPAVATVTLDGGILSVDGRQYVAVETGLGGGSPVAKPTALLPGLHHPNNGNALFVFALPQTSQEQ